MQENQNSELILGNTNRLLGWTSLMLCVGTGLVMGLWSFSGPVSVPSWIGGYGDLPRRLIRLGHIAFFGLGVINILVAREIQNLHLEIRVKKWVCRAMNFGNVFLPLTLFASALFPPLKYGMSLPAMSVFAALVATVYGIGRKPNLIGREG